MSSYGPPRQNSAFYDLKKPSDEFLMWFAGFLEGEGHVGVHENNGYKNHVLNVSQAYEKGRKQCEMIQMEFGGAGSVHTNDREDKENHGTKYSWWLTEPNSIAKVLKWIQPYLDRNTKYSEELEYYGIEETVPVWEQNEHYPREKLETLIGRAEATHNVIKTKYFPESDRLKTGMIINKPYEELEQQFNNAYTGEKDLDGLLEELYLTIHEAIRDLSIDTGFSASDFKVESIEDDSTIHIKSERCPGFVKHAVENNMSIEMQYV